MFGIDVTWQRKSLKTLKRNGKKVEQEEMKEEDHQLELKENYE